MSYLDINNIPCPVAVNSYGESPEDVGGRERAADGTMRVSRIRTVRTARLSTAPLSALDAAAWIGLIRGEGHRWTFNSSLYSSSGLGPTAGYGASISSSSPKFGAGCMSVSSAISFAADLWSSWSAMFWRNEGGTWYHYAIRSDGAKWKSGSRNDGTSTSGFFGVNGSTGVATLTLSTYGSFDDLVLVPYLVSVDWPAYLAASGLGFSDLPWLNASGSSIIEDGGRTVIGNAESKGLALSNGGSWDSSMRTLDITLEEV